MQTWHGARSLVSSPSDCYGRRVFEPKQETSVDFCEKAAEAAIEAVRLFDCYNKLVDDEDLHVKPLPHLHVPCVYIHSGSFIWNILCTPIHFWPTFKIRFTLLPILITVLHCIFFDTHQLWHLGLPLLV